MHGEEQGHGRRLLEAACPRRTPRRRGRGCSSGLRLALALELTSQRGACQGQQLDIRVAKGFYNRGYDFLRVSIVGEEGEDPPAWAPSFRVVERGECTDIGYLSITNSAICKAALAELRPEQKLAHPEVRRTSDPSSPYGCYLLEEGEGEESMGQLWIGTSLGLGLQLRQPNESKADNKYPLCRSQAYQASFFHRWTSKTLQSEVLRVEASGTSISVGGAKLHLQLPRQGQGVTGLLFSDPCFSSSGGVDCPNGRHMDVLNRLTEVLNLLLSSDEFQFWAVLGNIFNDQSGAVSSDFFKRLKTAVKLKPLFVVPGNRDFWIGGQPPGHRNDSLGYGFMQFYGQDTAAATPALPYRFVGGQESLQLAKAENFMVGSQIGDLALFGYSGAHEWSTLMPHAAGFCRFAGRTPSVHTVLILGHWASEDAGCSPGMDVPSVHARMRRMEGCSSKRVLYFAGHTHCNRIDRKGEGFLIGGAGMRSPGCSQFGVTVVQSIPDGYEGPDVRVDYFPIHEESQLDGTDSLIMEDYYYDLMRCLEKHGYAGCRDHHAHSFLAARKVPRTTTMKPTAVVNLSLAHPLHGAVLDPFNHGNRTRAGPDWLSHRTPESVHQFMSSRGQRAPSASRDTAKNWLRSHMLRLLCVTAASLLLLGLTVWAWFWIAWKKHLRKTAKCCHSPRRVVAGQGQTAPGSGRRDGEDGEIETISVAGHSPRDQWPGRLRVGGSPQEHRYSPVASAEPERPGPLVVDAGDTFQAGARPRPPAL